MQNDHYQAPKSEVYEVPDDRPVQYAGFWIRVVASLIDTVLMGIVLFPILGYFYGFDSLLTGDSSGGIAFVVNWILPMVIVLLFWIYRAATPGKMALGLRIVDGRHGGKCTTGQLLLRYLGYYLASIPLLLGIIWVGFDGRKQGWHDKIANTVVVKK